MKHLKTFENIYTSDFIIKIANLNKGDYYSNKFNGIRGGNTIELDSFYLINKFIKDLYKGCEFIYSELFFGIIDDKNNLNITISESDDEYFHVFLSDHVNKNHLKTFYCEGIDGLKHLMTDLKKIIDDL